MKKQKNNGSVIHIKLDYEEAIQSKMDTLSSQMDLLEIVKAIKKYRVLRVEELKLKVRLHRTLRETNTLLRKLEKNLPHVEMPEVLEKEREIKREIKKIRHSKTEVRIKKAKEDQYDSNIESQLKQLQKKLDQLND